VEFVRKIINSDDIESIVKLPTELKNKRVEILILPVEENKKQQDFDPKQYKGVLNIDSDELEKELSDMRGEWERL
jgi:hypothetical protein